MEIIKILALVMSSGALGVSVASLITTIVRYKKNERAAIKEIKDKEYNESAIHDRLLREATEKYNTLSYKYTATTARKVEIAIEVIGDCENIFDDQGEIDPYEILDNFSSEQLRRLIYHFEEIKKEADK